MGVRVPAPRRVFLPWVAGQRCWSFCCCSWQPQPRRRPRRPSLPATRLVIQRAGVGTSDRERGPRGVGAGEDESAFRPPPTVTVLGPVGRAKTNTELVTGRGVNSGIWFQGSDAAKSSPPPEGLCQLYVFSMKIVECQLTRCVLFIWSSAELCSAHRRLNSPRSWKSQHISLIHIETFHTTF